MTVEVYEHARHFDEVASWAEHPLDPATLGSGLVVPGVCCIFVDGIGSTRTALFYNCFTNPRLSAFKRTRALLMLIRKLTSATKASGFTSAVTCTRNPVVEHWFRRQGFTCNGERALAGAL